jgi:hypothetical protein
MKILPLLLKKLLPNPLTKKHTHKKTIKKYVSGKGNQIKSKD